MSERRLRLVRLAAVALVAGAALFWLASSGAAAEASGVQSPSALLDDHDADIGEQGCTDGVCGERIEDPASSHHSAIVQVEIKDENGETRGRGSGVLVEPGVVVTAAHVVTYAVDHDADPTDPWYDGNWKFEELGDDDLGEYSYYRYEHISVAPARDQDEKPYGEVDVEKVHLEDLWENRELSVLDEDHLYGDVAVLQLEEPVGREAGTFEYNIQSEADNLHGETIDDLALAGYPGVRNFGEDVPENTMWESTGSAEGTWNAIDRDPGITGLDGFNMHFYSEVSGDGTGLESASGHSGGPVYRFEDGKPTLLAVVHGGNPSEGSANDEDLSRIERSPLLNAENREMIEDAKQDWGQVAIEELSLPDRVGSEATFDVSATLDLFRGDEGVTVDIEPGGQMYNVNCDLPRGIYVDGPTQIEFTCTASDDTNSDVTQHGAVSILAGNYEEDETLQIGSERERSDGANLRVSGVSHPASALPGEGFEVTARLTNDGDETGTLSTGATLSAGTCNMLVSTHEMDPGEEKMLSTTCSVSPDATGTVDFIWWDYDTESEYRAAIEIDDPADISVAIDQIPSSVAPGEEFQVDLTARNDGDVPGEAQVSTAIEQGDCDVLFTDLQLGPGEEKLFSTTCTVSEDAAGAVDFVWSNLDTGEEFSRSIDSTPTGPDVELVDVRDPVMPAASELTVDAKVTNPANSEVTDEIDFEIDGEVVDTADLTLAGGESETLTRTVPVEPNEGASLDVGVESSSEDDSMTVSVAEEFEGVVAGEYEPLPGGSDGLYRDFNGDSAVSNGDIIDFFSAQHVIVEENEPYFDFTGDGTVSQADVVELFEYVTG